MRRLIWRLIRKGWLVQVALIALLASAVALFSIYSSFLARESSTMSGRLDLKNPDGYYLVTSAAPQENISLGANQGMHFNLVASWHTEEVPSNLGNLPITFFDTSNGSVGFVREKDVVAVHSSIAARFGLSEGDEIILFRDGERLPLRVSQVFETSPFATGINLGEGIFAHTGEARKNQTFLYRQTSFGARFDSQARASLSALHGRGSIIRTLNEAEPMGTQLVRSNYGVISQGKVTLVMFLALAFLTAKLLSYMDIRRMLAILKTLGLRRNQTAATVVSEAMIAPLAGALLGSGLTVVIFHLANRAGLGLPFSGNMVLLSIASVLPAVAVGVLVPARLAQVSTVNELLFERPVAMFRDRIDRARQRYPALDGLVAQGAHILRLPMTAGVFEGYIFRRLGERVQKGEVIALEELWWGMKAIEYVSPIDGYIVYFEQETGMIAVSPEPLSVESPQSAALAALNVCLQPSGNVN